MNDLKLTFRQLFKSPGFAGIAVLTLALGIGVNTGAFSVLNALLLHIVPYPRPDKLVRVGGAHAPANFLDQRGQNTVFERMAAFQQTSFNLAEPGQPADRLQGLLVTADFFPLLGVQPALGRVFAPEEDRPGGNSVLVLSHSTWLQRFGGDASILGRQVRINGEPVTVIGVMPPAFEDYALWGNVAAWRPMALSAKASADRDNTYLSVIARLKPGVSLAEAQSAMDILAAQLAAAHPQFNTGLSLRLLPLGKSIQDSTGRNITWLVMGLAGFVLLIACANLANLQFGRHVAREREHAIRAALGASRGQLMRRVLLESMVLSLAGGALGCCVALWTNDLAARQFALGERGGFEIPLDRRVLGFTLAISALTGIGFGLLPALLASRVSVNDALKLAGRNVTIGRAHHRLRHGLIVGEIALALVLLAGAGFFLRGLQLFTERDPGWRTDQLLIAELNLSGRNSEEENARCYEQLQARLSALPGVERAAIASSLPTRGFANIISFVVEGRPQPEPGQVLASRAAAVTPGFFETLGIRLLQGRNFTADDRHGKPSVVIINESMARGLWPGENPLGKRIGGATPFMGNPREIVGVVSDAHPVAALQQSEGRFQMYRPLAQQAWWESATIALRARSAPESIAQELRRIVAEIDPDHAVYQVRAMQQAIRRGLAPMDAAAWTLAGFAVLGVLLAAVGIYGVIAGFVTQRTTEIGIRMALGAQIRDVLRLVLGQGLYLALLGAALGLAGAFAVARLLASIIPALPSAEPATAVG